MIATLTRLAAFFDDRASGATLTLGQPDWGNVNRRQFVFGGEQAGSRPGGRPTFLLYGKKVGKEAYPAAPALAGCPRSEPSARPVSQTRYAQTARPDSPRLAVLRSAAQRGGASHAANAESFNASETKAA